MFDELELGDAISLTIDYRGKTPKKLGGDWSTEGYRALSAKNIKTGAIVQEESIRLVSPSIYKLWMKEEIQRGDILITSEAPFGQVFHWDSEEKIVLSQRLFAIRPNTKVADSRYLYYYMTSRDFQHELSSRATGTTVVGLRQPELLKCKVKLPPIEAQKQIAKILSNLDHKINLNARINDYLEQLADTLFSQLVNSKSDLEKISLQQLAEIVKSSFNPLKSKEVALEHYSIPAYDEQKFPIFEMSTEIKSNKFMVNSDCVLFSKLNPETKRVWRPLGLTNNAVCSTEFIVLKARSPELTDLLQAIVSSSDFHTFMCQHVTGTTGSRQRVSPNIALEYEFFLPLSKLADFSKQVKSIYALIAHNQKEAQTLKEFRDSLLSKLLSGEIQLTK